MATTVPYTYAGIDYTKLNPFAQMFFNISQAGKKETEQSLGAPTQADLIWDNVQNQWIDTRTMQQPSIEALQNLGLMEKTQGLTASQQQGSQGLANMFGFGPELLNQMFPETNVGGVIPGTEVPGATEPITPVDTTLPTPGGIDPGTVPGAGGPPPTIPTTTSGGTPVGPGATGPGPGSIPTPQAPPEPDWAALLQKILDLGAPQAPNVSIQFPEQEQLVAPPNPMDGDILSVMRKTRQDAAMRQGYRAAFMNGPRGIGGPSMEAWNAQLRESPGTLPGGGADAVMGRGGGPQYLGPPVQAGEDLNPLRGSYPSMPVSGQPNPFSVNPEAINSLANQASPVGPDLQKVAAGTASAVKNRKRPSDYLADEGGMTRRLF